MQGAIITTRVSPTSIGTRTAVIGSSTTIQRLLTRKRYLARPKLRRRQDASPSSPDHDLHYRYPTHELEFGLWVVTAQSFPSPPGRVPRRGGQDISLKA